MLKYIKIHKTLRNVSISTDHHQGECLYLVKVTLTLTRYRHTPLWWSVEFETCRSVFMYFMYFNIEIGTLY